MTPTNAFGEFLKKRRTALGLTLRRFAIQHGFDAGNLSRIERGLLPPPSSREILERYALALQLSEGSDEWLEFFDLAAIQAGRLPQGLPEEALVAKLPIFFRTLRGQRVPEDKLDELVAIIRKQYS